MINIWGIFIRPKRIKIANLSANSMRYASITSWRYALGLFVTPLFAEMNAPDPLFTDLEFNKNGPYPKPAPGSSSTNSVRPDIIIHNREWEEGKSLNCLAVECKKRGSSLGNDVEKLKSYIDKLNYHYTL